MNRSRSYYRRERKKHINRKKRIIKLVSGIGNEPYWYYRYEGELSKGKIHCSCPMCRFYGPSYSDMIKKEKMDAREKEYKKLA